MSSVAALPFAKIPRGYNPHLAECPSKPSKKLSRSMTHPHHDPTKPNSKHRPKHGDPFDPEDLTRRLTAYVAEQKLATQRRREARAARERAAAAAATCTSIEPTAHDASVYHHIPTVAASAFQRTATPNPLTAETVHKLSAPILKAALNPEDAHDDFPTRQRSTRLAPPTATVLQRTVLNDHVEAEKERLRNRNQFQLSPALEEAAEVDVLRDVYRLPQRTFGEFAHLRTTTTANIGKGNGHARPLSTGDVLYPDEEDTDTTPVSLGRLKPLKIKPVYDGRNDWAQEEEVKSPTAEKGGVRGVKEMVSGPFMRRKESVWVLMGKREKEKEGCKEKERRGDDVLGGGGTGTGESGSPPLDGKRGLLKRFRRVVS